MERNVSSYDRFGRYLIGAVLVLSGIAGYVGLVGVAVGPISQGLASILLVLIGAVLLVTGYTQQCPIYRALGIGTYRPRSH